MIFIYTSSWFSAFIIFFFNPFFSCLTISLRISYSFFSRISFLYSSSFYWFIFWISRGLMTDFLKGSVSFYLTLITVNLLKASSSEVSLGNWLIAILFLVIDFSKWKSSDLLNNFYLVAELLEWSLVWLLSIMYE